MNNSNSRKKTKSSLVEEAKPGSQVDNDNDEEYQLPVATKQKKSRRADRPSKTTPMIPLLTKVQNKYELREMIGVGGYGQIYKAHCVNVKNRYVAIKVMMRVREPLRMILEQSILFQLRGKPHFPRLYGSGNINSYMFIVMDLLGRSISDLRKHSPNKRFDPATAIHVGVQMLDALHTVHDLGFVHRDVKPANMCIGAEESTRRQVFLVDFGLARQFKANGKLIKRHRAGFRGTLRYVSVNVHERKDQCPSDDLVSLFYSIVEMSEGSLPWSRMRDSDDMAVRKKMSKVDQMCRMQPPDLYEFYSNCYDSCEDPNFPEYDVLADILKKCIPNSYREGSRLSFEDLLPAPSTAASHDNTHADNDQQHLTL